ncbi:MAG: hypothetical protein E6G35_14135 [Actinobacteria bacterium]|nr:MAG: hypothetical protein E6G35_14135 [Actinomycetota bacterium]
MKLRLTKQQLAMAGIAALTVVTAGIGGTLAVFTDTHSIDANTFSTTSVSLIVGAPTTTNLISLANMVPGVLDLTIKVDDPGVTAGTLCDSFLAGAPYTGKLSATASGGKLIGDSTSSPYPSSRTLAVSGSEVLCFQVSLAITYDNTYKSATTTATLTFNAEQTLHNP